MNVNAFSKTINGKEVSLYKLTNQYISCYITNYGARLVSLNTLNVDGLNYDVVLGFDSIDGYLNADEKCYGATVGRYANRIANGRFVINEQEYKLNINSFPNSLHGGPDGFHNQVWQAVEVGVNSITLGYVSEDGQEGFPGTLDVQVKYRLKGSDLLIEYAAQSSEDTVINLTHHSYFNLNGENSGNVLDHSLRINSDYYSPVNEHLIPTGSLDLVVGTPFDFTKHKKVGESINDENVQLEIGKGYDHNYVVNQYEKDVLSFVADVHGDRSGVKMEVWSTEPGVQLYTGNHLSGLDLGKSGVKYEARKAFCLETQHFPDSPNQDHFPSAMLKRGDRYNSRTEYRFSYV